MFASCCGSCFGRRPGGLSYFPAGLDEDDAAAFSTVGGGGRARDPFVASFGGAGFSAWMSRLTSGVAGLFARPSPSSAGYGGLGGSGPASGEDLLFDDEDVEEPEILTRQNINARLTEVVRGKGQSADAGFLDAAERARASNTHDRSHVSPFARLSGPAPAGFREGGRADDDFGEFQTGESDLRPVPSVSALSNWSESQGESPTESSSAAWRRT